VSNPCIVGDVEMHVVVYGWC